MSNDVPQPDPTADPLIGMLTAANASWAGQPPIQVELRREVALTLVGCIQMIIHFPGINLALAQLLISEGRRLQAQVLADDPELNAVIEQHWPPSRPLATEKEALR